MGRLLDVQHDIRRLADEGGVEVLYLEHEEKPT